MSGAMTYQIKVQTGDQIKGASVSDAISKTVSEAIADQLGNWGDRLIEVSMNGIRVYSPEEYKIEA